MGGSKTRRRDCPANRRRKEFAVKPGLKGKKRVKAQPF